MGKPPSVLQGTKNTASETQKKQFGYDVKRFLRTELLQFRGTHRSAITGEGVIGQLARGGSEGDKGIIEKEHRQQNAQANNPRRLPGVTALDVMAAHFVSNLQG
jgi:hypothetical protein